MSLTSANLLAMIRDSVATPRQVADRLLTLNPPPDVLLMAAALVSVLDALLAGVTGVGVIIVPAPDGSEWVFSPFAHAATLGVLLFLVAAAFQAGGQALGGQGSFAQSFLVVIWLEVVALAVQAAQAVVLLLLPPLAPITSAAGIAVLLWCLVHFVRALHGFEGVGRATLAILLGSFGLGLVLSLLLAFLGIGGSPNV